MGRITWRSTWILEAPREYAAWTLVVLTASTPERGRDHHDPDRGKQQQVHLSLLADAEPHDEQRYQRKRWDRSQQFHDGVEDPSPSVGQAHRQPDGHTDCHPPEQSLGQAAETQPEMLPQSEAAVAVACEAPGRVPYLSRARKGPLVEPLGVGALRQVTERCGVFRGCVAVAQHIALVIALLGGKPGPHLLGVLAPLRRQAPHLGGDVPQHHYQDEA